MKFSISAARPDITDVPSRIRTFYGEAGSTVRVDCSITPGLLVEQYYVTWRSAVDTSRVFYQSFPPSTNADPFYLNQERYTIDPGNFSLYIHDITPADVVDTYVCILGVEDTEFSRTFVHMATENVNLSLSIFSKFRILARKGVWL